MSTRVRGILGVMSLRRKLVLSIVLLFILVTIATGVMTVLVLSLIHI